jgi:SAM-dependent methyltransferase
MPFENGAFQTIVANSTLEHMPRLSSVLREVARVLRPGGRLIVTAPSDHFASMLAGSTWCRRIGLVGAAERYGAWFNRHAEHWTTIGPEAWTRRLEPYGFHATSSRYYLSPRAHVWFDALHYLGLPNLIARRLTGKWVPWPMGAMNPVYARLVRESLRETRPETPGPYVFLIAERLS